MEMRNGAGREMEQEQKWRWEMEQEQKWRQGQEQGLAAQAGQGHCDCQVLPVPWFCGTPRAETLSGTRTCHTVSAAVHFHLEKTRNSSQLLAPNPDRQCSEVKHFVNDLLS